MKMTTNQTTIIQAVETVLHEWKKIGDLEDGECVRKILEVVDTLPAFKSDVVDEGLIKDSIESIFFRLLYILNTIDRKELTKEDKLRWLENTVKSFTNSTRSKKV